MPGNPLIILGDKIAARPHLMSFVKGLKVENALLDAEEKGITSANVDDMRANSQDPNVQRLLGASGDMADKIGLSKDWAYNAIKQAGNYGEMFARNVGPDTPLKLERGLNALWTEGGLMYAPPIR